VGKWDTGFYRTAEVWVNVPQVDAGSDVFLGGDNAVVSRVVFDTAFGFAGVWHLDEDVAGIGAKRAYRDATPAGNHGDDAAGSPSGTGAIGRAQRFDAAKDNVSVPSAPSLRLDGLWRPAIMNSPLREPGSMPPPLPRAASPSWTSASWAEPIRGTW
jgi:hypothetical protein